MVRIMQINPSIDFLVFTDDHTEYNYPKNVIIHYMSFENMKSFFSRGHCSIYENSLEVNGWYKNLKTYGCQNYKDVFQSNKSCCYKVYANGLSIM